MHRWGLTDRPPLAGGVPAAQAPGVGQRADGRDVPQGAGPGALAVAGTGETWPDQGLAAHRAPRHGGHTPGAAAGRAAAPRSPPCARWTAVRPRPPPCHALTRHTAPLAAAGRGQTSTPSWRRPLGEASAAAWSGRRAKRLPRRRPLASGVPSGPCAGNDRGGGGGPRGPPGGRPGLLAGRLHLLSPGATAPFTTS